MSLLLLSAKAHVGETLSENNIKFSDERFDAGLWRDDPRRQLVSFDVYWDENAEDVIGDEAFLEDAVGEMVDHAGDHLGNQG